MTRIWGNKIHEAWSEHNLDAAMAVLSELKPGLDAKLLENATGGEMKLTIRGIRVIRGE